MDRLEHIIHSALKSSFSYIEYESLFSEYAANGKTTGPNQSEEMINYTKLNHSRGKRVSKTLSLQDELIAELRKIEEPVTFLLITETWCGDAANSVPVIGKIADENERIQLRIVLRDENPELIDEFLTNGGRSIPKLIILDNEQNVIGTWGPRPKPAQDLFTDWKKSEDRPSFHEFHITLQKWYNEDRSYSIQSELKDLLKRINLHHVKK